MKKDKSDRFWEIDALRGIAVLFMILFHALFDLNYFNIYKINLQSDAFLIYAYTNASIFVFLVGISLTLSYSKASDSLTKKQIQLKFIKRGFKTLALGLIITLATLIYLERGFVIFGILHFVGISILLAYHFLKFQIQNLALGILFVFFGIILRTMTFDFNWLLWLGFTPSSFYTIDYFPLLPWFGVVLIGIFLGNKLYPNHNRIFKIKDLSNNKIIQFFTFTGQHSLIIYFIHQPIIISIIFLLTNT